MPRSTFFSLKAEKRERIEKALVSEFENRTLGDAKVKHVVERLGISRGSFYQYFHNMQDAYFYILDLKLRFIHEGFFTLYRAEPQNIESVLEKYGVFKGIPLCAGALSLVSQSVYGVEFGIGNGLATIPCR